MKTPLGRRPRLVRVDDDPGLLRLITIRLRSEGFEVAACENASQALTTVPRFTIRHTPGRSPSGGCQ